MRNFRKLTAAVIAVALVLTSMTTVFAVGSAILANADKAVTLKDLGLYEGQDANDPKVGLEGALTTQDSLIFLAKLFGYYETSTKLTDDQVAEALAKFDDAASISEYAKNVVAYSAANNVLSGITRDDKFFVGAKDTVTAARFATFMLKQMGYPIENYLQSVTKLAETKGSKVDATITGDLTRDAAVGVMYAALTAEKASGKTVIADIVGDNVDLKAKAEKLGLIESETITDQSSGSKSESSGSGSRELTVVSVKSAKGNKVVLSFSKPINDTNISLYHSEKYNEAYKAEVKTTGYVDEITFTFSNLLPIGTINLYLVNSETNGEKIIDSYGIPVPDQSLTCSVADDPEIVYIKEAQLVKKNEIKLVFNTNMASIIGSDIELTNLTTPGSIKVSKCELIDIDSDGKTKEAVLTLDKDLSTDVRDEAGSLIGITTIANPSSVSELGYKLEHNFSTLLNDKTRPEIVKWDHDNDESTNDTPRVDVGEYIVNLQQETSFTITIYFSEDIKQSELEGTFVVDGFEIKSITAPAETKTVILEVMAAPNMMPTSLAQVSEISDICGNKSDSIWEISLENIQMTN